MTAVATIADQSDVPVWGWLGWSIFAVVVVSTWAIITRREHVRRQNRKRQGRA